MLRRPVLFSPLPWPLLLYALALLLLTSCVTLDLAQSTNPPSPPREFRAMWVATVANIDWPSRANLTTAEQQQEIKNIVATAKRLKMNALILQVRPSADALYASTLEPWSEYLSGVQGQAPVPFYDPLSMWITEAHESGIELHAWFNPLRARHAAAKSLPAKNHILNSRPDVAKPYGDQRWMDPGEPDATQRLIDVVRDVVRRYDVDGVHIDDYFYPYPVKAADGLSDVDFPDEPSWKRYVASGGKLSRADWRRENVNRLVQALNAAVHADKAWVKFGVSPFGLPRADRRPEGITGFSQYEKLYADVELWWAQGWLDYLAPQLYWPIAQTAQSFPVLLDYWSRSNAKKRHLWPGMFTSKIDDTEASWQPDEIGAQIELLRRDAGSSGHIHFSAAALAQNRRGISDALARETYSSDVLVPATPWLRPSNSTPLAAPLAALSCEAEALATARTTCRLDLARATNELSNVTAVWANYGGRWKFSLASTMTALLPERWNEQALQQVVVSRVDRYGIEGDRTSLVRQ